MPGIYLAPDVTMYSFRVFGVFRGRFILRFVLLTTEYTEYTEAKAVVTRLLRQLRAAKTAEDSRSTID